MHRQAIYTRQENVKKLIFTGKEWNFHDANTTEGLHSLHPYPAKFIPQIPRKAIKEWTSEGELVLDPFCGCGTTLLEAILLGRQVIGVDNNEVAVLISKAKTASYTSKHREQLISFLNQFEERAKQAPIKRELIPDNKNFQYWFSPEIIDQLARLKFEIFKEDEPIRTLLMAIFSSIIVRVSFQDSDTRYSRIIKEITPSMVNSAFRSRLSGVIEQLSGLDHLPDLAKVYKADTRRIPFVRDKSVSLIVTSPPYLNAYDYHKYHRQRLHWINGDFKFARDLEIGKHDDFTRPGATPDRYFYDMNLCFSEWERVLRDGGKCLVVVGDAIVNKKPVCVADTFINLLAQYNIVLSNWWIRELHATRKTFNARARINQEHVLLFTKHI